MSGCNSNPLHPLDMYKCDQKVHFQGKHYQKVRALFRFIRILFLCLIQQHKHGNKCNDREQEADQLVFGLDEGVIYRVVDRRHRQKCGRAGVEQFAFGMHKGHTVADGEGADTVHHSGTKATDEGICHRYGTCRTAENKCVFKHCKADTDQNGTFKQSPLFRLKHKGIDENGQCLEHFLKQRGEVGCVILSVKRQHLHNDHAELTTEQAHHRAEKEEGQERSCLAFADEQCHQHRCGERDKQN